MKLSYIKRFFLSYVLILIPSFVVFWAFASGVLALLRGDAQSVMQNQADVMMNRFDVQAQTFELSSMTLSLNTDITLQKLSPSRTSAIRCVQTLHNIKTYDAFISDVFISMDGKSYYSSSGMSSANTYARSIMRLTDPDEVQEFARIAADMTGKDMRIFTSANSAYLLFHHFMPANRGYEQISVNFTVDLSSLTALMDEVSRGRGAYVGIRLPNGQGAVFMEENGHFTFRKDLSLSALPDAAYGYARTEARSERTGVAFTLCADSTIVYGNIVRLQIASSALIAVILLVALLASYRFSKQNAAPIQQILRALTAGADKSLGTNHADEKLDELATIRKMISNTVDENKRMQSVVKSARRMISEQTMLLLLNDLSLDGEDMSGPLNDGIGEGCYCVALICLHNLSSMPSERAGECYAKLCELPDCRLSCRETISGRPVIGVLYGLPDHDKQRINREDFGKRIGHVCETFDLEPALVCMSRAHEDRRDVGKAHLEAVYVLNSCLSRPRGKNVVLFEHVVAFDLSAAALSREESEEFRDALASRDRERIDEIFNGFMAQNERKERGAAVKTSFRYVLLNSTLHFLMGLSYGQEFFSDVLRTDLTDPDGFARSMRHIFDAICRDHPSRVPAPFLAIVDYIRANYKDQNLSLEGVAEHVGLTGAYVSRLFKAKTGKRYIDHVTEIRMKEAMRLLSNTTLPLKEITQAVGYADAASFHKKFTSLYGMSPSKYREINRQTPPQ